jgi:hypothetical protein
MHHGEKHSLASIRPSEPTAKEPNSLGSKPVWSFEILACGFYE